ncbi:MAG: tRNA (adenosine(37)-N6)-threonylcarbamoyltransferase complex transferase subunit TsaD, partial [Candidatus Margulisiibacteriota bacterium]
QLVLVKDYLDFTILGTTKDDAAGEAFDKVAKFLGLEYPGGPIIEEKAKTGNSLAFDFPIGLKNNGLDFSFSGLKTAVIQKINKLKAEGTEINVNDVAASFQKAVINALLIKSLRALKQYDIHTFALSGGVAANKTLRAVFVEALTKSKVKVFVPEIKFATDNAAMIAAAGYILFQKGRFSDYNLLVKPNLSLC